MVTRGAALAQPLVTVHREIGLEMPGGAMREKYARLQVSQLHREELHKFEPWPRANTIRQVVRNPRSGTLIACELPWYLLTYYITDTYCKAWLAGRNPLSRG
jgi:hypothetical protein